MPLGRPLTKLRSILFESARPRIESRSPAPESDLSADLFLDRFREHANFAWIKINHGLWDLLANVEAELGWPVMERDWARADQIANGIPLFSSGFMEEFTAQLDSLRGQPRDGLYLAFGLNAWPGDNAIIGTPHHPETSRPFVSRYEEIETPELSDPLFLKRMIHTGEMCRLFDELRAHDVILVGPDYLESFGEFAGLREFRHARIPTEAWFVRRDVENEIEAAIAQADGRAVVLLQAAPLAAHWILRLRDRHPNVRWIDGGLALSICAPDDLFKRSWGKACHTEIARFHNTMRPHAPIPLRPRLGIVNDLVDRSCASGGRTTTPVSAVLQKVPDHDRVRELLALCEQTNRWTNHGPLEQILADAYHPFLGLPSNVSIVPCASCGVALEAIARMRDDQRGETHRWVVSSFSYQNLGRGYFSSARVIDCNTVGLLDLEQLEALPPDAFDGFVVTNAFGLHRDFERYAAFARRSGKSMLIDNAAGIRPGVVPWPYQAFSLHHTKPYGFGEGGLAIVPAADAETMRALTTYRPLGEIDGARWLNNGKLSEVACAYHLDLLERSPEWSALYEMQATRIKHLAARAGLEPLFDAAQVPIAMSLPFLSSRPITAADLRDENIVLRKYYEPLRDTPVASELYRRIVNVPAHPDVARVPEEDLLRSLRRLSATRAKRARWRF